MEQLGPKQKSFGAPYSDKPSDENILIPKRKMAISP
jgi:hypothetical protein